MWIFISGEYIFKKNPLICRLASPPYIYFVWPRFKYLSAFKRQKAPLSYVYVKLHLGCSIIQNFWQMSEFPPTILFLKFLARLLWVRVGQYRVYTCIERCSRDSPSELLLFLLGCSVQDVGLAWIVQVDAWVSVLVELSARLTLVYSVKIVVALSCRRSWVPPNIFTLK